MNHFEHRNRPWPIDLADPGLEPAVGIWSNMLRIDPIDTLIETGDEAIAYFVRRDLQSVAVDPIDTVWSLDAPRRILRRQRQDGSWLGPKRNRPVHPTNHTDLLATFKQVRLLVERYEFSIESPSLRNAAEWLFGFQTDEGDFRGFIANQYATYYTGDVLSLLIRAGYDKDPRVHRGLEWLMSMRQDDGGWTIPMLTHSLDRATSYELTSSERPPLEPDRSKPFSHNWTDMVLRAFAAHEAYQKRPEVLVAAELLKSSFFTPDHYSSYRHPRYWTRFAFWWPNLLTAMESLARLAYTSEDADMRRGIEWFIDNQAADGMWYLSNDGSVDRPTPLNEERRAWLTLRICRLLGAVD